MLKILNKINSIIDKLFFVIKKYILPIVAVILICTVILKWLGYDLYYSKMMQILKINNEIELSEMLALVAIMWIAYDNAIKKFVKNSSRNEYREYLLKELDYSLENSDINHSKESDTADNDKESKECLDNVIIEQSKTNKKDIIALMLKNNDEITEYFKISKSQAKFSFWISVISCIAGVGALAFGIYGIVILENVTVSVISLISGSISELISGTVFWVHNKSALQLNHYYNALHENEKFLSAVNIADKLSDEKKEEVLIKIIYKQINIENSKIKYTKEKEKNKQSQID